MPKVFFYKNNRGIFYPLAEVIKGFLPLSKVDEKINSIMRLEFENASYNFAVRHINHYSRGPHTLKRENTVVLVEYYRSNVAKNYFEIILNRSF